MEYDDREKAARVWQRVRKQGDAAAEQLPSVEQNTQGLLALITQEWEAAVVYQQLLRQFSGQEAVLLRKLFEQKHAHAARLKGIYVLMTGQRPVIRSAPPTREPAQTVLRRCYGAELRRLQQYEERSGHPEYGEIFAGLAAAQRNHCSWILELLGSLDG
jgi:hypothetical protein